MKKDSSKRRPPVGATVTLAALLVALPALSWLQFTWIGEASGADESRMRANLRATSVQFATDAERELAVLRDILLGLESDSSGAGSAPTMAATMRRVDQAFFFWNVTSPEPDIVSDAWLIGDKGTEGIEAWKRTSGATVAAWRSYPSDVLPDGVKGVLAATVISADDRPARTIVVQEDQSSIVLSHFISVNPARIFAIELDPAVIAAKLLPRLADKYFLGTDGLRGYRVRVTDRSSGAVVYDSAPGTGPFGAADIRVGLLSSETDVSVVGSAFGGRLFSNPSIRLWLRETGRVLPGAIPGAPPMDSGHWLFEARHVAGSLEAYSQRVRALNLSGSTLLLLLILGGFVYLYALYRRTRVMVRAQEDFVASVSHEIRTPLAVIRSAAENLAEGVVATPEQARHYGERMVSEADRMLGLAENILHYSGAAAPRDSRPLDAVALLRAVRESWTGEFAERGALVQLELPVIKGEEAATLMVLGNEQAYRALVDNLVTNALRYGMPAAGEGRLWLRLKLPQGEPGMVWLEVEDNGQGIAGSHARRIFEPFYRVDPRKPGGVGLGLSLVKRIAEAHGGKARLVPGKGGALFRISLPLAPPDEGTVESADVPAEAPAEAPANEGGGE